MSKGIIFKNFNNEKIYPCPYFPVGGIYISVVNENPSKYFGGQWEKFAVGRTIVGVDNNQSEFNQVQKTGGSKYLQKHSHSYSGTTSGGGNHYHKVQLTTGYGSNAGYFHVQGSGNVDWGIQSWTGGWTTWSGDHTHGYSGTTTESGTGTAQNLQPYITVYMWKRIS